MITVFECNFTGRAKIAVHQEWIDRDFYPTMENMNMTHKLYTDKNENRGGDRTQKVKSVITNSSTESEVKQAVQEIAEVTNHNTDVVETLSERVARLERMLRMQIRLNKMVNNEKCKIVEEQLEIWAKEGFPITTHNEEFEEFEELFGDL